METGIDGLVEVLGDRLWDINFMRGELPTELEGGVIKFGLTARFRVDGFGLVQQDGQLAESPELAAQSCAREAAAFFANRVRELSAKTRLDAVYARQLHGAREIRNALAHWLERCAK